MTNHECPLQERGALLRQPDPAGGRRAGVLWALPRWAPLLRGAGPQVRNSQQRAQGACLRACDGAAVGTHRDDRISLLALERARAVSPTQLHRLGPQSPAAAMSPMCCRMAPRQGSAEFMLQVRLSFPSRPKLAIAAAASACCLCAEQDCRSSCGRRLAATSPLRLPADG